MSSVLVADLSPFNPRQLNDAESMAHPPPVGVKAKPAALRGLDTGGGRARTGSVIQPNEDFHMNEDELDKIWDVELPPEEPQTLWDVALPPEEPRRSSGQALRILSTIGHALLVGVVLTIAILAIWGPSTRVDHQ